MGWLLSGLLGSGVWKSGKECASTGDGLESSSSPDQGGAKALVVTDVIGGGWGCGEAALGSLGL